eukprot:CAMPEP_0197320028 /NCGR_PEP_ID=MMETSP0891-20130614/57110_1 /TAXON_ID=44058 ORGANISM="Aureoumbra lagunensis, Strain CCMP1510" /NCGR_SAMPLE_ID=MMETSP0891 /ASSEMBLY_ACC=CAM_ASM_000534 /LENGTH=299 /DNA_ID=CAMNT_0042811229 /DNA_START=60 /DNA_END=959 /DNA_ORIENTATION=+
MLDDNNDQEAIHTSSIVANEQSDTKYPQSRKRSAGIEFTSRADRKRERERQRRAEVGTKFDELLRILNVAETYTGQKITSSEDTSDDTRVAILNRTIHAIETFIRTETLRRAQVNSTGARDLMGVAALATQRLQSREAQTQTDILDDDVFLVARMRIPHHVLASCYTSQGKEHSFATEQNQVSAAFTTFLKDKHGAFTSSNQRRAQKSTTSTTTNQQFNHPSNQVPLDHDDIPLQNQQQIASRNEKDFSEESNNGNRPRSMSVTSQIIEQILTSSSPPAQSSKHHQQHQAASYYARAAF